MANSTSSLQEFVLQCAIIPDRKAIFITVLLIVYLISFFGNLLVILIIQIHQQLQTAMYICICALAIVDMANSSTVIPKMVADLNGEVAVVPYGACMLQMYVMLNLGQMEAFILCFMALDRYVAVIYPLKYLTVMTKTNVQITIVCLALFSFIVQISYLIYALELSFCRTNVLPFCFCDYSTMVHAACNDNPKYLTLMPILVGIFGVGPLQIILFSYSRIAVMALKISSNEKNRKVFNTCLTHLMVVALFYIPPIVSFVLPDSGLQVSPEGYSTLFIAGNVVPPMLNPIIYTLRNTEIKSKVYRFLFGKRIILK